MAKAPDLPQPTAYPVIDTEQGNVFLVNKPLGWTSFDVVKKIRNALGIKKVGHAGTLDPLATGLLIVCSGKYTKCIDQFMAQQKEYTGTLRLGYTTPSYDAETEPVASNIAGLPDLPKLRLATGGFTGPIAQVPPLYSAIMVDGKRLYELARKGSDYVPEPRHVEIQQFQITGVRAEYVNFLVSCSKGTYIRSLAHDYGQQLGSGAYLTALCRTAIGDFRIEKAAELNMLVQHIRRATGRK